MASRQETADYILEQIAGAGPISARRMFGEYAIYCDGRTVAFVCDDQLFVKHTDAGRAWLGASAHDGFPYPGARPHFLVSGERWDDHAWMAGLIRATAQELPLPPPKKPRKRKMS